MIRRRSRTAQAGYTLMELLLVIAITGIIFVPLMAWAGLAIRQQPVTQDGMLRTASSGFLGSYLPKDVSVAGRAAVNGPAFNEEWAKQDCIGGPGAGGSRKLVLLTGGSAVTKIVYSEATGTDGAARSVWRRTCTSAGVWKSSTEVFPDVAPNTTRVDCIAEAGDNCRQIEMTVTPADVPTGTAKDVSVRATRRLDAASIPTNVYGQPVPTPDIQITSRQGTDLTFSGARSSVVGGTITAWTWEFETARGVAAPVTTGPVVSATFPTSGQFTVRLTVTDDKGNTATAFSYVSMANQRPVAVATATPTTGDPGATFRLSSSGSYDPDGAITNFEWLLTLPSADGVTPGVELWYNDPNPVFTAPAGLVGTVGVTLTVTDAELGTGTAPTSFSIVDPTTPGPGPGPGPGPDPGPGTPGQLTAVFVDAPGDGGAASRSFDASTTSGIGAGNTATYSWDFGDGTTGSGAVITHQFPNPGQYTVRLNVATSPDVRTAATARIVNVGAAPPAPTGVRFDQGYVYWVAVPGARRYLVDFEYSTATDCFQQIINQAVGAVPNPSKAVPPNPCPASAGGRARVGTDANGSITWSEWIPIQVNGPVVPPPADPGAPSTPEVVK